MYGHTKNLGIWSVNPFYRWVSDRMLPIYSFYKPFAVKVPDICEWQNRFNSDNKEGMGWYIDSSKTNKGTGAGVHRWGSKKEHSYTTVFQAEIYPIKACIMCNIEKDYTGRNIYFLFDRQPSRPLTSFQINSKLVWDFISFR